MLNNIDNFNENHQITINSPGINSTVERARERDARGTTPVRPNIKVNKMHELQLVNFATKPSPKVFL